MLIEITNNGLINGRYVDMRVKITKCPNVTPLNAIYFLSTLKAMYDTDGRALLNALELFLDEKIERCDNDE